MNTNKTAENLEKKSVCQDFLDWGKVLTISITSDAIGIDRFSTLMGLTLFGICTGGDTFIPLSFLDQILSADFLQKFPNFFGGENWHQ